jgi:hypothetical protein
MDGILPFFGGSSTLKVAIRGISTMQVLNRLALAAAAALTLVLAAGGGEAAQAPAPLASAGHPVDWWFAFKLNAHAAPDPGGARTCAFGGSPHAYSAFSQAFAVATSKAPALTAGSGAIGAGPADPLGATFGELYNGDLHYVVWNDQFYGDPKIPGCGTSCGAPWGHSKGFLAWDSDGAGFVVQVTTPDWPGAGSARRPRPVDGNTLGCLSDNDVLVSQHFFALRLTHEDVVKVLTALANASVVTNPANPQLVSNGGPYDIVTLVDRLGRKSQSQAVYDVTLSTRVRLISKPSALHVPPWQMVSSHLGGVPLRAATWWAAPKISSTTAATPIPCWSPALAKPGAVTIAMVGTWAGKPIGLTGGAAADFNHAKIGVSTGAGPAYAVFGDMNQQGALSGNCQSSQNGRGGLFYVLDDAALAASVGALIADPSAPSP